MKSKKLLIISLIFTSVYSYAQTPAQREVVKESIDVIELEKLKTQFQINFEEDEKNVQSFLQKNPTISRSYIKNGSLYYIKSIDKNGNPVYINTKSNVESGVLIKANSLYNGGSIGSDITGTGMVAGIWDGGQVRSTHELLSSKVTMQANQTVTSAGGDDHMTHVSGTIVGKELTSNGNTDGTDRATARGIAYNATSQNYDWDNDVAEMTTFAGNGFLISNHSYGMGNDMSQPAWTFGAYNDTAQQWDALLKTTPNYLPFVAGGNEQMNNGSGKTGALQGYDVITGSSASKNVVTVGAVNADRSMSDYSNFGPTDDGRIKPDICARGTGINSSKATSDTAYSGNDIGSSGTSYASPAAAAAALLLQQYYYSLNNSYMKASMLKCLLLHSADDEGAAGPDMKFGWGILNIETAAQIIKDDKTTGKARMHTFTTNPTNNSNSEVFITGSGSTSTTPGIDVNGVKASICWTDDEGSEQLDTDGVDPTTKRLVYNFDVLLRRQTPFVQNHTYKEFTMATLTDTAILGTDWYQNNTDNFKQTYIPAGGTLGGTWYLYMRKSSSSPTAVREVSAIVTGLTESSALSTESFNNNNSAVVFYNSTNGNIQLISNDNTFGKYSIFDMSGKVIKKGTTSNNSIEFTGNAAGVYIINYEANGKINNTNFIVK